MSSILLRGLRALEIVAEGPIRQADLARRLATDHSGISRILAAMTEEGWVVRVGGLYRLGPRMTAFGSPVDEREFLARSDDIVRLLSGITGIAATAVQFRGARIAPIAVSVPPDYVPLTSVRAPKEQPWLTASGIALLAQLDAARLSAALDAPTWLRLTDQGPADAAAVRALVDRVHDGEAARERGWSIPGSACIALPWPDGTPWAPTCLALVGFQGDFDAHDAFYERLLRAAVSPGADRASIIRAAAG